MGSMGKELLFWGVIKCMELGNGDNTENFVNILKNKTKNLLELYTYIKHINLKKKTKNSKSTKMWQAGFGLQCNPLAPDT